MLDSSDDDPSSAIERSLKKAIKGGKKGSKVNKKKNIDDFDESDFDDKGSQFKAFKQNQVTTNEISLTNTVQSKPKFISKATVSTVSIGKPKAKTLLDKAALKDRLKVDI